MLEKLVSGKDCGFCTSTNRGDLRYQLLFSSLHRWLLTALSKSDLQVHFC